MMGTVSVVIPTWNRAALLEKSVRSALTQTVSPLEILVCDDGSTDDTALVIKRIDDERIVWLPGSHSGRPAIPRNLGIRESKGTWIAFLDSDDEWLPDRLEKQLSLAQRLGCKAVCSNATRSVPGEGSRGDYLSWKDEKITFDNLLRVNLVICSSALVHRSLFAAVAGFPEDECLTVGEDYALWLRIATQTEFAYHPEPLVVYRDDAATSVRGGGTTLWKQRRSVFSDFINWGSGQDIATAYLCKTYHQLWCDAFRSMMIRAGKTIATGNMRTL